MIRARIVKRLPPGRESREFTLDVDLNAAAGVTVLFGPSGSGKTLTLDAIAGFCRPDEGRILLDDDILFDGRAGVHLPPQQRQCGYVFQNYALFPHMTLRENLEFAAHRFRRLDRHRRVGEMLERFRLSEVAGRRPHELSGGQKQRCSIARALVGEPRLLLLDEPGRGLDLPLRHELYEILRQIRAEMKTPIVLVTHDLEECFTVGDEMVVLQEGRVAQAGAPRQVVEQPASIEVARLLGAVNVLAAEILALDPQNNSSRLRLEESGAELNGPYIKGKLIGARVLLYGRAGELRARPAAGRPGLDEIPAVLLRVLRLPDGVRLEFEKGITVDMPGSAEIAATDHRNWYVGFPAPAMRVLGAS